MSSEISMMPKYLVECLERGDFVIYSFIDTVRVSAVFYSLDFSCNVLHRRPSYVEVGMIYEQQNRYFYESKYLSKCNERYSYAQCMEKLIKGLISSVREPSDGVIYYEF